MAKSSAISIRVSDELKAALEKAAQNDRRSVAAKAELVLADWLHANGYLAK